MPTTPPPAELGKETLGWSIGVVFRAWRDLVPAVVAGEIPHAGRGYQILELLDTASEPPTQADVASHLGIDRTVLTYVLDDLQGAGLLERRVDPTDRRARRVVLTDDGRATLDRLRGLVDAAEERLLHAVDPADRQRLRDLLHGLAHAIHAESSPEHVCTVVESVLHPERARRRG